jgi:hypothetical protein
MKKLTPYLFIAVLLLQLVNAGEIFNDEVKDNMPFKINGIEHIARYYPSAKKASILAGTDRVLAPYGECTELNDLKYCIDSVAVAHDEDTGDPATTMQLRVLQSGPELDIDRDISEDNPNLNEEVEVTATITNTGNEWAYNVNYEDSFPIGVKVSSAYYNMMKNGILWAGNLAPEGSQKLTYKLKFEDFVKFDSTAKASVIFNNKMLKYDSSTTSFEVQRPYTVSDDISSKSVGIKEDIEYTLYINHSSSSQDLIIDSVEFTIPSGAITSHRSMELDLEGDKIKYSGTISGVGSKELSFKFKSLKPVKGELTAKVKLRVGSQTFTEEFKYNVGLGVSQIMPSIIFNPDVIKGGAELEVEAKVTNEGESAISGISINMAGDIVEPRGWRNIELDPEEKHYAFNKIINAPAEDEEKTYFVKLSGSYKTSSGKTMEFEDMKEVTVLAQEKIVELTPKVIVDGKEVNVTLKVRNIAGRKLGYISLIDTLPKGFKNTAGARFVDLEELGVGEEVTAYSYIVKVPDTFTGEDFHIIHVFNGLDSDEDKIMTEKKTIITLDIASDAEEEEEETDTNASGQPDNETGEAVEDDEEKKPGIFKRMWSWIKGLFSGDDADDEEIQEEVEEELQDAQQPEETVEEEPPK